MTKAVIIHIGQSKTGTTAIQRLFWANRGHLAARSIHYLQAGVTSQASPAHYGLLSQYFRMPTPNPTWGRRNRYEDLKQV